MSQHPPATSAAVHSPSAAAQGLLLLAAAAFYMLQTPGVLAGAIDTYIKAPLQVCGHALSSWQAWHHSAILLGCHLAGPGWAGGA